MRDKYYILFERVFRLDATKDLVNLAHLVFILAEYPIIAGVVLDTLSGQFASFEAITSGLWVTPFHCRSGTV